MQGGGSNLPIPGAASNIPGVPANTEIYVLSEFQGLNTRNDRPSIGDQQLAWSDNLMPIDKGNLRALYDVGPALYTASGGKTIVAHGWTSIGSGAPIMCLVFLSDGSAVAVNLSGGTTAVAPAGTITPNAGTVPAFAQYGNQYACIVSSQTNGYFIWDGTNFYQAGTVSPSATLNDGGTDYTSAPTVTVHTTGSGTGAAFSATVADGSAVQLTCTNPGSGFAVGDLVWPTFSGGGAGTSPQATATLNNGVITGTNISSGGHGYYNSSGAPTPPTATITDPTGTGASANVVVSAGVVTELQIISGGSGYSNPSVSFSGGNGSGAAATLTTSDGVVTGVTVTSAGSGLVGTVTATMLDPNGSGAQFDVMTSGGAVTNIAIGNSGALGGSGYTLNPIVFSGGGLASASLSLMPVQVNGTGIETYQGSIWITGGSGQGGVHEYSLTFFTGPDSATDFSASGGGGVFPSTDSFLRAEYTGIKQALGFLYLFGDSSANYISGVQRSGTPVTTTFSNLNIDPTIGTVWPESILVYGTTPIFANPYGVHAIIGGSIKKISEQMDGLFDSSPALGGFRPSSALHTLYGKHVYLFNYRINNPYTGSQQSIIMCWDGARWWTYSPSVSIVSLSTLEAASNIVAYGTDGTKIYPLLTTPAAITKTLKSKLRPEPTLLIQKKAWGFFALFGAYASMNVHLSVTVDTENGSTPLTFDTIAGIPSISGPYPTVIWAKSAKSQGAGLTMGFSIESTSEDFVLYQAALLYQAYVLET